jgi:hypothetical protein
MLDEGENDGTIIRQDKTRQDKTRQDKTRQDKSRQVIKVISLTSFYATKRKTEFTTKRVSSVFSV